MVNDKSIISFIIEQATLCEQILNGIDKNTFINNIEKCYAVSMAIQVICENSIHISKEIKEKYKDIPWDKMSGLRNLISHDYGKLLFQDIYDTATIDIPKLKTKLINIFSNI